MINLLEYLEKIVQDNKIKQKIAFAGEKDSLTFWELYQNARAIGSFLAQKGCQKEPVIVFMEKSAAEIAAFLGIMYAGCYYVPVDREMPAKRIEHIFVMMPRAAVIVDAVSEEILREQFPERLMNTWIYEEIRNYPEDISILKRIRKEHIDTDPAYVVFTSGSTGMPKGVVANHRSVIDYVEQLSQILEISEHTVFGNQAPFYVDACLKEIYPTLKFGASTWLISKKTFRFPLLLVQELNLHKINTICWVVPALTMISSLGTFDTIKPEYLHTIAFGSEVFPVRQFNLWYENVPARYFNLYGPTECTGMSAYFPVKRRYEENEVIPIGKPFPNTEIFLAEQKEQQWRKILPQEEEKEGELFIRGTCVTMGYYENSEKTGEAFIQNPLQNHYPELVYRTGDIGKYVGGELVFVSRRDDQIKHMGQRIELGEIDAAVQKIEGIASCCSIFVREEEKLVLFFTGEIERRELMAQLKKTVPSYMLPAEIHKEKELPLTLNGKTDKRQLRQYYESRKERKQSWKH